MKTTLISPFSKYIFLLKFCRLPTSTTAGMTSESSRAAIRMARSVLPTIMILWSKTFLLLTVLCTEELRELDFPLLFEASFCWVALLLDPFGVELRPLFPLDLARDLFSISLAKAVTSSEKSSLRFLLGLPREIDCERLSF